MSTTTFLLIDFENLRDISLASLPIDYRVLIFVGRTQNNIPFDVTRDAQQLGTRLEGIKMEGDGHNNLDFHLIFYLGQLSAKHREAEFLVLTRDKGFDAVIRHAVSTGLTCSRIESLSSISNDQKRAPLPDFEKACEVLSHIAKNSRPRKRKTLTAHINSMFQKKVPSKDVERIVELLFTRQLVSEAGNTLTYHF